MRKLFLLIFSVTLGTLTTFAAKGLDKCKASMADNVLTISNNLIEAKFDWNNGNFNYQSIKDLETGKVVKLGKNRNAFYLAPNQKAKANASYSKEMVVGNLFYNDHLAVNVTVDFGAFSLKRMLRVYPNSKAIFIEYHVKGAPFKHDGSKPTVFDKIDLGKRNLLLKSVRFYGNTDHNNNLVDEREVFSYNTINLKGKILTIKDRLNDNGLFILKKAPLEEAYCRYPGADFVSNRGKISINGVGIEPSALNGEWKQGYAVAIGIAKSAKELDILSALRKTQMAERNYTPQVNDMVMMNTWGDRSRDARMSEKFILNELDKCKELGVTHFQLDDGWQAGLSHNSAFKSKNNAWAKWEVADWMPHKERFPNGLEPLVAKAKKLDIKLGLWFNPSSHNDYETWENDANILIGLYKKYGIRIFKIDGMQIENKRGEENFMSFYHKVIEGTNGKVIFNLDVTAGKRFGYHFLHSNNNLFLENRYSDWATYYPFRTLRNVWQLSKYVPAQLLQIEFLNKWRNAKKYGNDPLAPAQVPFDYTFALTSIAQPLAWFEASGLPKEAFSVAPTIKAYNKVSNKLHSGTILPIGNTPDGMNWTGFQSIINEKEGYILVLREYNQQPKAMINTWLEAGKELKMTRVFGKGAKQFKATTGDNGKVMFQLPEAHTFALYHYSVK